MPPTSGVPDLLYTISCPAIGRTARLIAKYSPISESGGGGKERGVSPAAVLAAMLAGEST